MPKSKKKLRKTKKSTAPKKGYSFFSKLKKPLLVLLPVALILVATSMYIFLENPKDTHIETNSSKNPSTTYDEKKDDNKNIKKLQDILTSNKIYESKQSVLDKKTEETTLSESDDFKNSVAKYEDVKKSHKPVKKELNKNQKPKLAIVIDDVAFPHQIARIKSIDLEITPSLMPKSSIHPDTPKLAKTLPFYMIHLPLEALNYNKEEINTLRVGDSVDKIESVIKQIKRDFPDSVYVNNHTGSKFTADYNSMHNLLVALKDRGFVFVDSRTTAKSKAKDVSNSLRLNLLSRDVFIDNKADSNYIRGQLKKAVIRAKNNGYALAIGHPSKITLETIRTSKEALKDVDVVYLDKLYEFVYN